MRTPARVRYLTSEDLLTPRPAGLASNEPPLQQIVVSGLLSFAEEVRFDLGRLTILVGPNGSGKSNFVDCLRLLRQTTIDVQDTFRDSGFENWLYKGADAGSGTALLRATVRAPGFPELLRHEIRFGPPTKSRAPVEELLRRGGPDERPSDPYFVGSPRGSAVVWSAGAGRRSRARELGANEYDHYQSILKQVRDAAQYPAVTRLAEFYASFRIYSEWTFGRRSSLRDATQASRSDTVLSESMDDLALVLNGLEQTPAHVAIRALLPQLKETYRDYVTRIFFGRVGLELVESPFSGPVPAGRLSDGTLRFLALAAILLQPHPPALICLEEPELGMHPDMIRIVADMIADASARTQLIVTTHSEHLLSGLQQNFDVLFAFDAGVSGSVVRRFDRKEFEGWRDEHALGELWTSGELGGNRW